MFKISMLTLALTGVFLVSCAQTPSKLSKMNQSPIPPDVKTDTATFGEGCFWCTEAFFQRLNGVYKVISGYGGGFVENPTYEQVCDKNTGHVELCQIIYDPAVISYDELLEVFWKTHDPTTIDRQGNDAGPQYRSVIFYQNQAEKEKAESYKKALDKSGAWSSPIVTGIEAFKNFYPAENYHQNYYNDNQNQGYCRFVIQPKLEKFEKVFKNKLKKQ
ncbi:MAG: peptide-methionine (S)-S-oxide reductase MsrA [Bacteroidota bacterium]